MVYSIQWQKNNNKTTTTNKQGREQLKRAVLLDNNTYPQERKLKLNIKSKFKYAGESPFL